MYNARIDICDKMAYVHCAVYKLVLTCMYLAFIGIDYRRKHVINISPVSPRRSRAALDCDEEGIHQLWAVSSEFFGVVAFDLPRIFDANAYSHSRSKSQLLYLLLARVNHSCRHRISDPFTEIEWRRKWEV